MRKAKLVCGRPLVIKARVPIIKCDLSFGVAVDISLGAVNGAAAVEYIQAQVSLIEKRDWNFWVFLERVGFFQFGQVWFLSVSRALSQPLFLFSFPAKKNRSPRFLHSARSRSSPRPSSKKQGSTRSSREGSLPTARR